MTVKDKGLARYCHFCNFVTAMLIETFKNKGQKVRTQKKGIHTSLYPNPECLHKPKFFILLTSLGTKFGFGPKCDVQKCSKFGPDVM